MIASKKFILRLILIGLFIAIFLKLINLQEGFARMKGASILLLFLALFLYSLVQLVKAIRFWFFLRCARQSINFKELLIIQYLTPLLGRFTPMKSGEVAKVFIQSMNRAKGVSSYVLERMYDLLILIVLSLFGIIIFRDLFIYFLPLLGFLLLIFCMLFFFKNIQKFIGKIFAKYVGAFESIHLSSNQHIFILFLSVIVWVLTFLYQYVILKSLSISLSFGTFSVIMAISTMIGILSGVPGGFGTREISMVGLLQQQGMTSFLAQSFTLLFLFFTILSEVIFFIAGWIVLKIYRKNKFRDVNLIVNEQES